MGTHEEDKLALQNSPAFQAMPPPLKEWIQASPHACADFRAFFDGKGQIRPDASEKLASYRSEPQRELIVSEKRYHDAYSPNMRYSAGGLFSMIAHEIGHDKDKDTPPLGPNATAEEYVEYRSLKEAKAIFNAFPIGAVLDL